MEFSVVLKEGRPKSATRYFVVQGRDNGPLVQNFSPFFTRTKTRCTWNSCRIPIRINDCLRLHDAYSMHIQWVLDAADGSNPAATSA